QCAGRRRRGGYGVPGRDAAWRRGIRAAAAGCPHAQRGSRDAAGARRARHEPASHPLDARAAFSRGDRRMTEPAGGTARRARLFEYAPWILRDYAMNQGPSTAIVVLMIGFLTLLPVIQGFTGTRTHMGAVPELI